MVKSKPVSGVPASKVLYSIHDYPASISASRPDSGLQSIHARNNGWGYVITENIAAVWVGEMGASMDNTDGQLPDQRQWWGTLGSYINGSQGANGGPTFSGNEQPVSTDWWAFGPLTGEIPDGTLNPDGSNRQGQYDCWSTLLYYPREEESSEPVWSLLQATEDSIFGSIDDN